MPIPGEAYPNLLEKWGVHVLPNVGPQENVVHVTSENHRSFSLLVGNTNKTWYTRRGVIKHGNENSQEKSMMFPLKPQPAIFDCWLVISDIITHYILDYRLFSRDFPLDSYVWLQKRIFQLCSHYIQLYPYKSLLYPHKIPTNPYKIPLFIPIIPYKSYKFL